MQKVLDEIPDEKLREKIIQKLAENTKKKEEEKLMRIEKTQEQLVKVILEIKKDTEVIKESKEK